MNPSQFCELTYEVDEGVAVVTLNRPEKRNLWSGPMAVEYRWALHHADQDPAARVVVVTGAGSNFCAGADVAGLEAISDGNGAYEKERAALPPPPPDAPPALRHNHTAPLAIGVPVIAAIEGACAGAGFVVATYTDLRLVSATAKVTTAFARFGLPAEYGIGWLLPRLVGIPNALDLLYDTRTRSGAEVAAVGWAQLHPAGEVLGAAVGLARRLARESSPQSLRTMKRQVFVGAAGDLDDAYRRSVEDMNAALAHPDLRVGIRAQRRKSAPDFLA
ncbi:MAG TPA: enoyl-CoA hydratase-related protein [Acidimicrobiales bacterium]|nr:enoyl-CoA hydratase-related protein [Acidimicrobiales bacterium]